MHNRQDRCTFERMKKDTSPNQKMLNTWAIVVIIWSVYRSYFSTELPIWIDELIAKPAVFLIPVWYYITKIEKGKFLHSVDLKIGKTKDIIFGLLAGFIVFGVGIIAFYLKNNASLPAFSSSVYYYTLIALASSFSEEILSRGFVLKRLYEESKNIYTSVFFASFLFFMLHIPILFSNPAMHGALLIQVMILDLLLSFGVSLAYLQRKNVIVAIIIHAFYNLGIYLIV